jgi:PmbA protein
LSIPIEHKTEPAELAAELAKKLRGLDLDGWELFFQQETGTAIEARDQKLESFESESTLSLALRLIKSGRPGFAYCSDFREQSISRLLKETLDRARHADRDRFLIIPGPDGPAARSPAIFDPEFDQRSDKEKIQLAMNAEKAALDFDSRIKRVRGCEFRDNLNQVWIVNSRGMDKHCRSTRHSLTVSAVAEQKREAQMASEFDWSFRYNMLDPLKAGRNAAKKAVAKLGAGPIPSRKAAVVFAPEVSGEFMALLSYALNGESLAKHKTWLRGVEGKRIFSKNITIIDDGRFEKGPDAAPFDDEGVATQKKLLVKDGVLRQFFFDTYYGGRMKKSSTGNARREAMTMPPTPGPTNFFLKPGAKGQDELLKEMGRGFLLEEVLGMHMADEISGDFSVGVSGHLVEGGKISAPVSGVAIAGNLKDLLNRVAGIGSDLRFLGNAAAPSVLIEELEISGS